MSSGFFGFFAHTGMLAALEESGLRPVRATGSSAGALVAGAYAAGLSADALSRELTTLERGDFWDPGPLYGVLEGGLLRGELFRARLRALLPVGGFEACRVPVSISTFDVKTRRTLVLDQGDLATAIAASCAVPGLFQPVRREGRVLLDGGILDRPGLQGVPSGTRVLAHHLASRSPWRREREMVVPRREGLVALVIDDLPRSGPRDLDAGRRAMRLAHEATRRALGRRLEGATVRISA